MTYMPEIEKRSKRNIIAQFRITQKELDWIESMAQKEECSKSEILRNAFEWYKLKRSANNNAK